MTGLRFCCFVLPSEMCALAIGIRYGKYCGVGWTGCAGEKPCDDVDACCQIHDDCVGMNGNYSAANLIVGIMKLNLKPYDYDSDYLIFI